MFAFYDYDQPLQGTGPAGYHLPYVTASLTDPSQPISGGNWMDETTPPNTVDSYFTEPNTFTSVLNANIQKVEADYDNPPGYTAPSIVSNCI